MAALVRNAESQPSFTNMLIRGPAGCGKTSVLRLLHDRLQIKPGEMVYVNCFNRASSMNLSKPVLSYLSFYLLCVGFDEFVVDRARRQDLDAPDFPTLMKGVKYLVVDDIQNWSNLFIETVFLISGDAASKFRMIFDLSKTTSKTPPST